VPHDELVTLAFSHGEPGLKNTLLATLTLLSPLLAATIASGVQAGVEHERRAFQDARQAIAKGNWDRYRTLREQLKDYALYPYLEYEALRADLNPNQAKRVAQFVEHYPDVPLAKSLREDFLSAAGAKQAWHAFDALYANTGSLDTQCYHIQAKLVQGGDAAKEAVAEGVKLWLSPKSLPDACDSMTKALTQRGALTQDKIRQRIQHSMEANQVSLAQYLAKKLPVADQKRVEFWAQIHRQPATLLNSRALPTDHPMTRSAVIHGLARLARNDAGQAMAHWESLRQRYTFTSTEVASVNKKLGLAAAYEHRPDAHTWLEKVNETLADDNVREWRVRTSLRALDWQQALADIQELSPSLQKDHVWLYWKARALDALGQTEQAETQLRALAQRRSYYGFLAADKLDQAFAMNHQPIETPPAPIAAVTRARELYALDLKGWARRELAHTLNYLPREKAKLAAWQAHEWGWHDLANTVLEKSQSREAMKNEDDLRVRFPTPYKHQVARNARSQQLDPAWIYGVMRQESVFMPHAESPVGARGLMQLMPATGKQTAKALRTKLRDLAELFHPDTNIQLGSAYLRTVVNQFNGHQILATAAYNAGPARVKQWLPNEKPLPADVWIETIPFKETRGYTQAVTAFTSIFQWRLGQTLQPLNQRMRTITPDGRVAYHAGPERDENDPL
jgi:soluble lytic murein transglycosylase